MALVFFFYCVHQVDGFTKLTFIWARLVSGSEYLGPLMTRTSDVTLVATSSDPVQSAGQSTPSGQRQ